ncbi:MAG: phosphate ABC transporter substrate-binding protein [Candidatus Dadabacteria bacterium]|nr:MAG: phosphate ABC transporter substrate-binding protein [Candidatus Dadabacteria bacterium]
MKGKAVVVVVAAVAALTACSRGSESSRVFIQNKGSDTLVNLAQSWAQAYRKVRPDVAIAVSGGGSGTGIAALINGTVDIANASRDITPEEREKIRKAHGVDPVEHIVAYDAVAFFVHPNNPLREITIEQLACIYGEGGPCEKWSDLGVEVPGCAGQQIIRVSRQSNSGTYFFVREHVLGKDRDYKLGSRDMQGNKDVVDLVSKTPCAIGYSGMGYLTDAVRALCVAPKKGAPCARPTPENAISGKYPLARPLYMYTLGEPKGAIAEYIEWIRSPAGQKIVAERGFVPIR